MNQLPTVSVLMTAYNRENYIGPAIESVRAQTFKDWELVIVDDASKDNTVEVARKYAASDRRIRVEINEKNLGDYGNRNRAASLARGRFLKYHDSDDLMYPYCLDTMVTLLESEPQADFALSGSSSWSGGPCPMLLTARMCYQREFLGSGMFSLGPSCALFRREWFERIGYFPLAGPHSDVYFLLEVCKKATVLLIPGDLFWYRIHPGQHLQRPESAFDRIPIYKITWQALNAPDCPLNESEREQAKKNFSWIIVRNTIRAFRSGRFWLGWLTLRSSGHTWRDWIQYFRRPRRSLAAGFPLDMDGEYVVPKWISTSPRQDNISDTTPMQ